MNVDEFSGKFNAAVLEWARLGFAEELRTNFERAEQFDNVRNREMLSVLRRQSAEDLGFLAKVLPLGVFRESPDDINNRNRLPSEERQAVEKLRADFDHEYRVHFYEHTARFARRHDKLIKEQFNIASRKGNAMIKEIASQWEADAVGAARGEWGLILRKDWLKITVSLKLARYMEMGYHVGVSNLTSSERFRFHDSYLGVLGFGMGQWDIETADQFPEKLLRAAEFAMWHVRQYEELLDKIDYLKTIGTTVCE